MEQPHIPVNIVVASGPSVIAAAVAAAKTAATSARRRGSGAS